MFDIDPLSFAICLFCYQLYNTTNFNIAIQKTLLTIKSYIHMKCKTAKKSNLHLYAH